jgi:uncharacterized membrane protein
MNYFQRLWTKTPCGNKITLAVIAIIITLIPIFCLGLSLSLPSQQQTLGVVVSIIAIPLFLFGIPFGFAAQDLVQIEKREREEAKDRQNFLSDESGYLDKMAAGIVESIVWQMDLKDLTITQKRKFVNKILYKIVAEFRGLGKEKRKI